jgi:hypothetical protein
MLPQRVCLQNCGRLLKQSEGIMIVVSKFSRLIATLKDHGRSVVLIDTNKKNNIRIAKEDGLDAKLMSTAIR